MHLLKTSLLVTFLGLALFLMLPLVAFAHEGYILTSEQVERGMHDSSINVFDALKSPENLKIALQVSLGIIATMIIYFFFQISSFGRSIDEQLKRLEPLGHLLIRIALGASLIASAYTMSFLGPEIPLSSLILEKPLQLLLYIFGGLLLVGIFTEIASLGSLVILLIATIVYKDYMITYLNYYGELLALILFGSRIYSLDKRLFGQVNKFRQKLQPLELPLIRITYGLSVMYPAITIKILHPRIILDIVSQYRLTDIKWLFPSDALLISLGTGLAQIFVGVCIILGFQTRINSLTTFILYCLSIIYFKEAVWPHYILLALAIYLVINNGGNWGIDSIISRKFNRRK